MIRSLPTFAAYLLTLFGTIVLYAAYAWWVVPWIEGTAAPPPRTARSERINNATVAGDTPLQHLMNWLPADGWERQPCKRLEVDDGIVLFDDYLQRPDGAIEVFPFTLVVNSPTAESDSRDSSLATSTPTPPIVVRASQRAELHFDRPFSMGKGKAGKLVSCQLQGEVQVYRQPSPAAEGFQVLGRNLHLTPQRIFSLEDVRFQFGAHQGSGRNLIIDLVHKDSVGSINTSFTSVAGLKRLELAFLEQITLVPDHAPAATAATVEERVLAEGAATATPSDWGGSPIRVTAQGPLIIDFEQAVAHFRDRVQVLRLDDFRDEIQAADLKLFFGKKSGPDAPALGELQRVQVVGEPASVELHSQGARITGAELEYDLVRSEIRGYDSRTVCIAQQGQEFRSGKVRYQLRSGGGLGRLIAEGPGEFTKRGDTPDDSLAWSLAWAQFLTIDDSEGAKLITVAGDVQAQLPDQTSVSGQQLELRLRERISDGPPNTPSSTAVGNYSYDPLELLVDNRVLIRSPQLEGQTQFLKLIWPAATAHAARPANSGVAVSLPRESSGESLRHKSWRVTLPLEDKSGWPASQDDRDSPTRSRPSTTPPSLPQVPPPVHRGPPGPAWNQNGPLARPVSTTPEGAAVGNFPAVIPAGYLLENSTPSSAEIRAAGSPLAEAIPAPKKPLQVTSDLMTIFVNAVAADASPAATPDFQRVLLEGKVLVQQPADDPARGPWEWELRGGRLQLTPQTQERYEVHVSDQARWESPELTLRGDDLHVDQSANRLWINGPGELNLRQIPAVQSAPATPTPAEESAVHVAWQAGMIFDGEKVYFEHRVQAAAQQPSRDNSRRSHIVTRSEGLSLQLNQRVNFSQISDANQTNLNRVADPHAARPSGALDVEQIVLVQTIAAHERAFPHPTAVRGDEPVVLEKTDWSLEGEILEKQLLIVPYVLMNWLSGDVRANGPGGVISWKGRTARETKDSPFQLASRPPQTAAENENGIEYLHINFDNKLIANTQKERFQVTGHVRALRGSVPTWEQQLDPDRETTDRDAVRITCQQIDVARWQPRGAERATAVVTALGNARVQGALYEAVAHRLTYDEGADLLTLEGDERNDAQLQSQSSPQAPRQTLAAGKIRYRPSEDWYQIDDVKRATVKQPTGR